ncbi:MAG: FIST C-terminal domain-containing protein [Phycisphaerales bacterium]|nr:FIST C-terminal domain-containing protein [Phycisphaerales bacterium]
MPDGPTIPNRPPRPARMAAGLSGHLNALQAAEQAAHQCADGLCGDRPDVVFCFISSHHIESAATIIAAVERRLNPSCLIGVSAEAVLGGEVELEGTPGISLLAASLPNVTIKPFTTDDLPAIREGLDGEIDLFTLREAAGLGASVSSGLRYRGTFLFIDPFSVPVNTLLPLLARARTLPDPLASVGMTPPPIHPAVGPGSFPPILGGMASSAQKPGENVLILNDRILRNGGIGISLLSPEHGVRIDSLVSQGCRPIGPTYVVTGVRGQLVTGLGGKPAIEALTGLLDSLGPADREQVQKRGLFMGRAIDEYKKRFGRDDFLIRNVFGVDQSHQAVAVMDLFKVGQTVQFHMRDQATATEDLALLLDAQQLRDRPVGALLFTCNGRGTKIFDEPHHDAKQISRAFSIPLAGEEAAKMGFGVGASKVPGAESPMPLSGFFAAGEIGPVGNGEQVFVHGQTACLALFRQGQEP